MRNIVTIWGGNGHSHLLWALKNAHFFHELHVKSIVSMSDDGRTTGKLMKQFEETFDQILPPPWDLRRCLYALSESPYSWEFQDLFEHVIKWDWDISDFDMKSLLESSWVSKNLLAHIKEKNTYFLSFSLSIAKPISWHKLWNILMACLYQNFLYDYNYMLRFMHDLLDVSSQVIAVTTDKAIIEAELENWKIVKKQDNISNTTAYKSKIKELRLMDDSLWAKHNFKIDTAILEAEYIIISAWDLFTSNISNLIIWGINSLLRKTNAKIIYIGNTTNKWWETEDYSVLNFILTLEAYLWKIIDVLLLNKKMVELWKEEEQKFKNDISVKGGSYIYLTLDEKQYLQSRSTRVVEADLLDETSLYKHDSEKLAEELSKIIL